MGAQQDLILGAEIGPYKIGESLSETCEVAGGEDYPLLSESFILIPIQFYGRFAIAFSDLVERRQRVRSLLCLIPKQTQWETWCAKLIWGEKTWRLNLPAKLQIPSEPLRSHERFMWLWTVSGCKLRAHFNYCCIPVPPTGLQILEKPTYVSEARVVTCQAMGGFPPPEISWSIGTRQLQPQQMVSSLR